ncbi:MAG: hypothetical protein HY438_02965 [DPANN group archaeon]|nr:hypothetical protein [DPANN group archaeon]
MGQYIPNISLARYFDMVTQAAARARSDVSILELQRLRPQLDIWTEVDLSNLSALDDSLRGIDQCHIIVRVPLSGEQDLVQSVQAFHYWQMYVPGTKIRKTWVEIVTSVRHPEFDSEGKLLGTNSESIG